MKRELSLLCTAALILGLLAGCANTSETTIETQASNENNDIAILYTNDIHTYIDGPFRADPSLSLKEQRSALRNQVYEAMCKAAKHNNVELIQYIKIEE